MNEKIKEIVFYLVLMISFVVLLYHFFVGDTQKSPFFRYIGYLGYIFLILFFLSTIAFLRIFILKLTKTLKE